VEDLLGNMEVAVEDIKYRTVALDRVRQMNYQFVRREFSEVNSPAGEYDVQEEPDVDSEPNESDIIKTYDFEKL